MDSWYEPSVLERSATALVCAFLVVACGDSKRSEKNPPTAVQKDAVAPVSQPEPLPLGLVTAAAFADDEQIESRWRSALFLAKKAKFARALALLSALVAADYVRFSQRSITAVELGNFLASAHGAAFKQLLDTYGSRFRAALRTAVPLLARMGRPNPASGVGDASVHHRSEVFAYAQGRLLRLTHTGGAVAGFFHDIGSRELIYVSYRKVLLAKPEPNEPQRSHMRLVRIRAFDLASGRAKRGVVSFRNVRSVALFYANISGKNRQLVAKTRAATRKFVAYYALNLDKGARTPLRWARASGRRLYVAHDDVVVSGASAAGVVADWGDEGEAAVFRLKAARKTITLPNQLQASNRSMRWSPDETRLVFASQPRDECSKKPKKRAATVFVVEAATGKLTRIATTQAAPSPHWLDNNTVVFAAGAGMLKVIDIRTKTVTRKLKTGVRATTWLASLPVCDATRQ